MSTDQPEDAASKSGLNASPVVELRQYTLKPGRRDTLIDIFDGHLIEGQEAAGMTIIGQFRDLDRSRHVRLAARLRRYGSAEKCTDRFLRGTRMGGLARRRQRHDDFLRRRAVAASRHGRAPASICRARNGRPCRVTKNQAETNACRILLLSRFHHLRPGAEADFASRFEADAIPVLAGTWRAAICCFCHRACRKQLSRACRCDQAKTSSSASPPSTARTPMPATKQSLASSAGVAGIRAEGPSCLAQIDRNLAPISNLTSRCLGGERRASSFFPASFNRFASLAARNLRLKPFVQRDTPVPNSTDPERHVSAPETRTETDTFGPIEVAADRYWGAQAQRSLGNFKIGWEKQPLSVVRALGIVKRAAAEANMELKRLDPDIGKRDRRGRAGSHRRQARTIISRWSSGRPARARSPT